MSDWKLIPNPEWKDQTPRPLGPATCHDGSMFITVECDCGEHMHMHETQIAGVSPNATIGSKCKGCGKLLEFPPAWIPAAFEAMRELGWIK